MQKGKYLKLLQKTTCPDDDQAGRCSASKHANSGPLLQHDHMSRRHERHQARGTKDQAESQGVN